MALTPAEQALAASPDGAAKVQEFHRRFLPQISKQGSGKGLIESSFPRLTA